MWDVEYGLNWTASIPGGNVKINLGGDWQSCALGEVYDLAADGFWQKSAVVADPNFMKIGVNNSPTSGLHVVVGVRTDGVFQPIYVDMTPLPKKGSAKYQPQESVQFWYETGLKSSTMISNITTHVGSLNMSKPSTVTNKFYYSITYEVDDGAWVTSPDPPKV